MTGAHEFLTYFIVPRGRSAVRLYNPISQRRAAFDVNTK